MLLRLFDPNLIRADELATRQKASALSALFAAFAVLTSAYLPYVLFNASYEGRRVGMTCVLVVMEALYLACIALCRRGRLGAPLGLVTVVVCLGVVANTLMFGELRSSLFTLLPINLLVCFATRRAHALMIALIGAVTLLTLWLSLYRVMSPVLLADELGRALAGQLAVAYIGYQLSLVHAGVIAAYAERRARTERAARDAEHERRRAEEARRRAERASLLKGEFLASISHELRTPLNAILGYSEMIQEELELRAEMPSRLVEDVARVQVAGRHLLELIQDVLNLSDIESGELKMRPQRFVLEELCADVINSMELSARAQGSSLCFEPDASIAEIESDPVWVRQILFNVLSNAVKFTKQGRITVRLKRLDERLVALEVEDTGIGMTAAEQERVFEEFVQANAETLREFGGTGLGLSLCYKLARAMGGELSLQSVAGQGTCVRFTFAVRADERRVITSARKEEA